MTEQAKARCPLERFTVYWCEGYLGVHIDGNSGTWNGARLKPVEVVQADVYERDLAAARAELADERKRVGYMLTEKLEAQRERDTARAATAAAEAVITAARELRNWYSDGHYVKVDVWDRHATLSKWGAMHEAIEVYDEGAWKAGGGTNG
jgi:hypothetical protein